MTQAFDSLQQGIMLCSRPNQLSVQEQNPFISRVDKKENLGINPIDNRQQRPKPKRKDINYALRKHKAWLESFKGQMRTKFELQEYKNWEKNQFAGQAKTGKTLQQKNETIQKQVQYEQDNSEVPEQKEPIANSIQQSQNLPISSQIQQIQDPKPQKPESHQREKPQWAYTEKEKDQIEEKEQQELLNFAQSLDYEKFIKDFEVQTMIKNIVNRVYDLEMAKYEEKQLKEQGELQPQYQTDKQLQQQQQEKQQINEDDNKSVRSLRSNVSHLSQKEKPQSEISQKEKNWDTQSQIGKEQRANIEERIAKQIADDVLKSFKSLRNVHSNASIRRLIEKEVYKNQVIKALKEGKYQQQQ